MRSTPNLHIRKKFPVVCIDGGPCSGKTTGIPIVASWLETLGYIPIVVPESATIFMKSGFRPDKNGLSCFDFQRGLLYFNMEKENRMIETARRMENSERVVLICDRGTMNARGYMATGEFDSMLRRERLDYVSLRDKRYDTVIHLRTAALGAEAFYKTDDTRQETPEQARERDQKTLEAWVGCPHLTVIDNRTDFKGKIERLKHAVAHAIGYPERREREKKWLIYPPRVGTFPVHVVPIEITQIYLKNTDCAERIRRRAQLGNGVIYFHAKKTGTPGNMIEDERQIDARTHYNLRDRKKDTGLKAIRKTRYCFVWNEQYYELDYFRGPRQGIWMLEAEQYFENQHIDIPPFLTATLDVTHDEHYSNYSLART